LPEFRPFGVTAFALAPAAIDSAGIPVDQEADMKQFVAMTDDVLYRSEGWSGPLVPYQCGVFCWHRLRDEAAASVPSIEAAARSTLEDRGALSA